MKSSGRSNSFTMCANNRKGFEHRSLYIRVPVQKNLLLVNASLLQQNEKNKVHIKATLKIEWDRMYKKINEK